jgi:hypothetical protein
MSPAVGYLRVSTRERGAAACDSRRALSFLLSGEKKRSGALWITPPSGQDRHGVGGAGPTLIHE